MTLTVDVEHRLPGFTLRASFAAPHGLTALFGRSGAGKTTLVNLIGGLIRPDRGRIAIDNTVLVDTDAGIFLPKHRRRIGYVFQEGRLFPHMTVRQNLLYGRWFTPRAARYGGFDQVLTLLGIEALLGRRPTTLSGGEKQRVAIGRALLASPRLLLMDEPLASLDAERKDEILPYLERLRDQSRVPIVYVSHAVGEVSRLANTMVLLADGRVQAVGQVAEVMGRLDLITLTDTQEAGAVLTMQVAAHDQAFALTTLRAPGGELKVPRLDLPLGSRARVRIRAQDVIVALAPPVNLSALNHLRCTIVETGPMNGPIVELKLRCGEEPLLARITRLSYERLHLENGRQVHAVIKSVALDRRSLGGPVPPREPQAPDEEIHQI